MTVGQRGVAGRRLTDDERRTLMLRNQRIAVSTRMKVLKRQIHHKVTQLETLRRRLSAIEDELARPPK
jgi:hypothetical protein